MALQAFAMVAVVQVQWLLKMCNIMIRIIIFVATIFNSTIVMAQSLTFDSAVRRLYFDVDIVKAAGSLADTFISIDQLHHNDTVTRQSSLNVSMQMNSDNDVWSYKHVFTFTKSPIFGLKIKSGHIDVTIGQASKIKKLLGLEYYIDFNNKIDADLFFERLKEIFKPLATKQKMEFDKDVGYIAQFSTRRPGESGLKDVTFVLGKSLHINNYQISVSLINEFMDE
jgi:hypothetical protein